MENKELLSRYKEWWIEEKNNKYFLFVKHNNKTYQASVDKDRIDYAMSSDSNYLREEWVRILVNTIESEILRDELSSLL